MQHPMIFRLRAFATAELPCIKFFFKFKFKFKFKAHLRRGG